MVIVGIELSLSTLWWYSLQQSEIPPITIQNTGIRMIEYNEIVIKLLTIAELFRVEKISNIVVTGCKCVGW